MKQINSADELQVGQTVWIKGVVSDKLNTNVFDFPIIVKLQESETSFTKQCKYYTSDKESSLYVQDIEEQDAFVSDDGVIWRRERVIKKDDGYYIANYTKVNHVELL